MVETALLPKGQKRVDAAYNLTVEDLHTYYVGDGIPVHNTCEPELIAGPRLGTLSVTAKNPSASEVRAAEHLAGRGNRVVLRDPSGRRGEGTSDLLVNDAQWDVYTPTSSNPDRIVSTAAKKGSQVRGGGVVIDLTGNPGLAARLGNVGARVSGITGNVSDIIVLT